MIVAYGVRADAVGSSARTFWTAWCGPCGWESEATELRARTPRFLDQHLEGELHAAAMFKVGAA